MPQQLKVVLVIVGAVICSTVVIRAVDMVPSADELSGLVLDSDGACPVMTSLVRVGDRDVCIDQYEASPGEDCPHQNPASALETEKNLNTAGCSSESRPDVLPWRFVNQTQAARACASAGKRLLTNAEWYRAALGTTDAFCNLETGTVGPTGESCLSSAAVYDTVGNVWEWTDEMVEAGLYHGREIPLTGYVSSVDADGVVVQSSSTESAIYGSDYVSTKQTGVQGMVRGGFYGSDEDGGLYALNASVELSFASAGIGFRCLTDR